MKLKFEKNENGEVLALINEKSFSTKDYIEMIKDIKNKIRIGAEFGDDITEEEKEKIESMLNDINNIKEKGFNEENDDGIDMSLIGVTDEINTEDIPF